LLACHGFDPSAIKRIVGERIRVAIISRSLSDFRRRPPQGSSAASVTVTANDANAKRIQIMLHWWPKPGGRMAWRLVLHRAGMNANNHGSAARHLAASFPQNSQCESEIDG
jgi:hypothetical protein